jgi:hypothetical protein
MKVKLNHIKSLDDFIKSYKFEKSEDYDDFIHAISEIDWSGMFKDGIIKLFNDKFGFNLNVGDVGNGNKIVDSLTRLRNLQKL